MRRGGCRAWRASTALALLLGILNLAAPAAWAAGMTLVPFAGDGRAGSGGDGGDALAAQLSSPGGVAADASSVVYIADSGNHRVRRVQHGVITTFAGTGRAGSGGDGAAAAAASLNHPGGVAVTRTGEVLIADSGNHLVRRVDGGVITSIAGTGSAGYSGDGDTASSARLREPRAVAVRPSGAVYVADTGNHAVRKIDPAGRISTVAGTGQPGYSGDGGDAEAARLHRPAGLAVTSSGTVYVADTGNHVVRRIAPNGTITTVAGTGRPGYSGDGRRADTAALRAPTGVVVDGSGRLVIADSGNHVLRVVDGDGTISTISLAVGDDVPPPHDPVAVTGFAGGLLIAEAAAHRVRLAVDVVPAAPELEATTPASPANDNEPRVRGRAPMGTTVRLYSDPWCTAEVGSGPASSLAAPGISVQVPDDRVTSLYTHAAGVTGATSTCAGPLHYIEDSTAPSAPSITSRPRAGDRSPTWRFDGERGAVLECQLSAGMVLEPFAPCQDARTYELHGQPSVAYTFSVRATDAASNVGPAAVSVHSLTIGSAGVPLPGDPDAPSAPADPDAEGDTPGAPGRPVTSPYPVDPAPAWSGSPSPAPVAPPSYKLAPPGDGGTGGDGRGAGAGHGGGVVADGPQRPDEGVQASSGGSPVTPRRAAGVLEADALSAADVLQGRWAGWSAMAAPQPSLVDPRVVLGALTRTPVLFTVIVLLVAAFLLLQHRIDRQDPKLALAPMDDDELEFTPLLPVRVRS